MKPKKIGISGAHNLEGFKEAFAAEGFDIDDCILNVKEHPFVEGVYEIQYRLPARRNTEIIPNQYKMIDNPKTVYDPAVISDEQMIQWGMEAMETGVLVKGDVEGYASNGLKFKGYLDQTTGEIKNFHPML